MHYRKWQRIPFGLRDFKITHYTKEDGTVGKIYSANLWPSWKVIK